MTSRWTNVLYDYAVRFNSLAKAALFFDSYFALANLVIVSLLTGLIWEVFTFLNKNLEEQVQVEQVLEEIKMFDNLKQAEANKENNTFKTFSRKSYQIEPNRSSFMINPMGKGNMISPTGNNLRKTRRYSSGMIGAVDSIDSLNTNRSEFLESLPPRKKSLIRPIPVQKDQFEDSYKSLKGNIFEKQESEIVDTKHTETNLPAFKKFVSNEDYSDPQTSRQALLNPQNGREPTSNQAINIPESLNAFRERNILELVRIKDMQEIPKHAGDDSNTTHQLSQDLSSLDSSQEAQKSPFDLGNVNDKKKYGSNINMKRFSAIVGEDVILKLMPQSNLNNIDDSLITEPFLEEDDETVYLQREKEFFKKKLVICKTFALEKNQIDHILGRSEDKFAHEIIYLGIDPDDEMLEKELLKAMEPQNLNAFRKTIKHSTLKPVKVGKHYDSLKQKLVNEMENKKKKLDLSTTSPH